MFDWIVENLGTIIVLTVLIAIVTLIIVCRIRAKKRGESSCGCKCPNCAGCSVCHSKKDDFHNKPSK
ncbi:MAG: FeoB-associated Cys-rich membrane protein [Clostridiales bacterium]|nr:FeoB-associated Cys-rich membrane protein [Clostridiales bacterium]